MQTLSGDGAGSALRLRVSAAVLAVVTVALGLAVRQWVDGDVAKYAGDALYALLINCLVVAAAPRLRAATACLIALAICVAVELFQLTSVPGDLGAHSRVATLVLGTTFNAPDLFWYAVGVLAGWTVRRLAGRPAVTRSGRPQVRRRR